MCSVVGEHRVDFVGDEFDERLQEVCGSSSGGAFDESGKSKLGGAIHGHEEPELAFLGPDLGEINVEVADGIGLELLLGPAGMALQFRQPADAMTLKTAVQDGAGELRDSGLQGVETVILGQQRVLAKSHANRLFLDAQRCGTSLLGTHGRVMGKGSLAPLLHRLRVQVVTPGQRQQALLTMLDRPTNRRRRAGAVV